VARVTVAGQTFECRPGQSVLKAMEGRGVFPIKVGCRNGGCGVCKVRVRSGGYHTGKMSRAHVTVEEEAQGWTLACRTFCDEDLELELPAPKPG